MPFTKDNPLQVEFIDGQARQCLTLSELVFLDNEGPNCTFETFIVPIITYSDGGSIPTLLRIFALPYGIYIKAYILHDFVCQTACLTRKEGDALFHRAMKSIDKEIKKEKKIYRRVKRRAIHWAVRIGGGGIWKKRHGKKARKND